jgi:cysteinyl-tRNA synthetase, unknown class
MPRTLVIFLALITSSLSNADISTVNDWLYVISMDDVSIEQIADSGFDLVVMDYSKNGAADGEYLPGQIEQLHDAGMTVIAYFSIGEAEDYRFYWNPAWNENPPVWLGPENPDWQGNYKVRYWNEDWRKILMGVDSGVDKSYLDRIIDMGFDGVYLDIVDAFEYWSDEQPELTRIEARRSMKDLLQTIKHYAINDRQQEHFYIFPQNASAIIVNENDELDDLGREYLSICEGIGAEDTWYNETDEQDSEEMQYTVDLLYLFKEHSLSHLVLSVDYIWNEESPNAEANINRCNNYHSQAREHGFLSYAAQRNRDLNEILSQKYSDAFLFEQPVPNISTEIPSWKKHQ